MSATLHELRQNLAETKEREGRRSSKTQRAFEALVRGAAEAGAPLGGLRHHVADETERFFSYTIPGPDGHVYWDGARTFVRNDGGRRTPLRWWWQRKYGNLDSSDDLANKCGEKNCVNPEHYAKERVRGNGLRYSDEKILGALQVAVMRLGHTPTSAEWDALHLSPSGRVISSRFGTWERAVAAAGLPETVFVSKAKDRTSILRGIQFVRRAFGRWPSEKDYRLFTKELAEAGLPTTAEAARRLYGSFVEARRAAGGPTAMRSTSSGRTAASREAVLAGLCMAFDHLGHWPTRDEYENMGDQLRAAGFPGNESPARRVFGTFAKARTEAQASRQVTGEDA